jgi:hypothetical protein
VVLPRVGTNIPEAYANGSGDDQAFFQNLALFLTGFFKTHINLLESTPDHQAALLIGAIDSRVLRKQPQSPQHPTPPMARNGRTLASSDAAVSQGSLCLGETEGSGVPDREPLK